MSASTRRSSGFSGAPLTILVVSGVLLWSGLITWAAPGAADQRPLAGEAHSRLKDDVVALAPGAGSCSRDSVREQRGKRCPSQLLVIDGPRVAGRRLGAAFPWDERVPLRSDRRAVIVSPSRDPPLGA